MKANIFLDLEGTIIDDLESYTFLENNCKKIKNFVKTLPIALESVNIFTWGWLRHEEIEKDIVKRISDNIGFNINSVLTKEDSLISHARINCRFSIVLENYERELYDSGFTKEQSFIEMFRERSLSNPCILIDDQIEYTKTINFLGGTNKKFFIEVAPTFTNMSLINPKNL